MRPIKNPFKVLNLDSTIIYTSKEIKDAYLKMVKLAHPDSLTRNTKYNFQDIQTAYDMLKSENSRTKIANTIRANSQYKQRENTARTNYKSSQGFHQGFDFKPKRNLEHLVIYNSLAFAFIASFAFLFQWFVIDRTNKAREALANRESVFSSEELKNMKKKP